MARTGVISLLAVVFAAGCGENSRPTGPNQPPGPALRVDRISPNSGPPAGGTPIQIIGTGFVNGSTLVFAGISTPSTYVSSTALNATAPAHAPGPVDVVVTNPGGASSRLSGGFTYADQVVALRISGNTSLRAVGETSQLTATADYPDGSTADITREVRWMSSVPAVATIAADGLVTAHGLGSTTINAQYAAVTPVLSRSTRVDVTPSGTFVLSGRARQPGSGGISDVLVAHPASGQSVRTENSGFFTFGGLSAAPRLTFSKDGFETVEAEGTEGAFLDVPMQFVVRIAPGSSYTSRLAPNDVEYEVGGSTLCQPCRMIRITGAGTVRLRLSWSTAETLQIWHAGQSYAPTAGPPREVVADIPVTADETQVHVGTEKPPVPGDYITFTLTVTAAGGGNP